MTKHLLKLNEIEDQFRELTNKFEEVNFKLDKLSNRVSKIQSDSQLRFSDLESGIQGSPKLNNNVSQTSTKLPGSEKAKQLEESNEEVDNGPDLVEVKKRMTNLKRQFNKTHKVVESKGRHSKESKTEFEKLSLIFKFLKFSPKMFEDLAFIATL